MQATDIHSAEGLRVPVNHRGDWVFVRIVDKAGHVGWGEASHSGDDAAVIALLEQHLARLPDSVGVAWLQELADALPDGLVGRCVLSGIEHAVQDLAARQQGLSVCEVLAGRSRQSRQCATAKRIDLYANINRMYQDRSAATVADAAQRAVAAGVMDLKFAPFDEATVKNMSAPGARIEQLLAPGQQRLQAIRDAVGPDIRLMIDCHWRFAQVGLADLARVTRDVGACWLEDPVPELTRDVAQYLRDETGALITGGEHLASWQQFELYVATSGADVLIADVKFVGGIGALDRIARLGAAHDMQFAPHNPSGPVSTAASAHVALANANTRILEFPFGEVDWRHRFAPNEHLDGPSLTINGPGLGVDLELSASQA